MSYNNFKEKVWAKAIERELERVCVYAEDTNQSYTGQIKQRGDTVRIKGIGKPTITEFGADEEITLAGAEHVEDSSVSLVVDKVATFNYAVGDIDEEQGATGVLEALSTESSEACANVIDKHLSALSNDKQAQKLSAVKWEAGKTLEIIDSALQKLYENDVTPSTKITVTLSPKAYMVFKRDYITKDTDNSAMIENGKVAKYGNAIIKMSNNVATDKSGNELIQVKTSRAIALAKAASHVEPYRPEDKFEDAVKGFVLFGMKIVRPKEMVVIPVNY